MKIYSEACFKGKQMETLVAAAAVFHYISALGIDKDQILTSRNEEEFSLCPGFRKICEQVWFFFPPDSSELCADPSHIYFISEFISVAFCLENLMTMHEVNNV